MKTIQGIYKNVELVVGIIYTETETEISFQLCMPGKEVGGYKLVKYADDYYDLFRLDSSWRNTQYTVVQQCIRTTNPLAWVENYCRQ